MPKYFHKGRNQHRRTDRFIEDSGRSDERAYYDHDTRGSEGRQVHRGPGNVRNGRIDRHRNRGFDSRRIATIIEEDVDMAGSSAQGGDGQQRFAPYKSGRRVQDRNRPIQSRLNKSDSLWNKVIIPHGKKYEKELLLKTLLNASKLPFIPIYYHIEANNAVFFVEDRQAADSLHALNRQITMSDGFKLGVLVRASPAPNLPINEELKAKILQVMSRRYDSVHKLLNLKEFHLDEELCSDYYTPLSRENVLQTVVKIIGEHIPDVQAIDMSRNKIYSLEQMKPLVSKATSLRSLDLGYNRLSQMSTLDRLKGLPLEELILNQNPICDQFDDRNAYISAVRKPFPNLMKLDGVDLPPVIKFDIETENVSLPASKGSCFVSEQAQQMALLFLEQYLAIYDSDNRQPLLDAYHDSAVMSMTISFAPGTAASGAGRLDSYMKDSRNLKRVEDTQRRDRLLHQGKADVVAFLSKLPKTTHDATSLIVDVPIASSILMEVSVSGIFRERNERGSPLRWFQRVFIIVPQAGGSLCIANEQLHISCATPEQIKASFKEPTVAPVAASIPAVAPSAVVSPSPAVPVVTELVADPILRQQMVLSFAEQSGMNADWSLKCLEENGWDFDRAALVFSELNKANQIPPEAFIK